MEDEAGIINSPSLKSKLKQTCLSCCFRTSRRKILDQPASSGGDSHHRFVRAKASSQDNIPEIIREKCRTIFAKIGQKHYRRHSSADFRYDPLSYSLNFDDDIHHLDESRLRTFASSTKTPVIESPPPKPGPESPVEIPAL